jgi:hypothetical protein
VAHDSHLLDSEAAQQFEKFDSHLTLRVALTLGPARWSGGRAIAAEIGSDDEVPLRERRDDAAPAVVRLRETVKEKHGRTASDGRDEIVGVTDRESPVLHVRNGSREQLRR